MLHSTSVKTRFLVSVSSNGIRAIIGFASGLLIARGLNPSGYGDLMFLLGSFVAIRSLLDMGTSSAFYTFLSQHSRGRQFYLFYFAWLLLQFTITLLFIALIIPDNIFKRVWLGHNREIVLLAFLAAFMQQQVWQMVGQIGESMRKTVMVQLLNISIVMAYLAMVSALLVLGGMSVENILYLMIVQYVVATLWACRFLREDQAEFVKTEITLKQMVGEFWLYCRPMITLSVAGFLYTFVDTWMLQRFGGASQQGYFQIAAQFAQVSLLATISILNIFWKEIADALAKADHDRVASLYRKVSRGLVMLAATITGFLLPWSEQTVTIFLGQAYVQAWPVLAIMLLYPIFQSMGQIGGTMLLASGQTYKHMVIGTTTMFVAIPVSYFVLAPASGGLISGLGLGAVGMATKMVLLDMLSVNIQAWVIARYSGWKFDWLYQVIGIPLMIGLGYLAKTLVGLLWNLDSLGMADLIIPVALALFVYIVAVVLMLWLLPWLIGLEREDIERLFERIPIFRMPW